MDAEYTLTEDDFLQLHLHGEQIIPALRWRSLMICRVIPIGAVAYAVLLAVIFWGSSSSSDKMLGLTFIGMALLFLLFSPKLHKVTTRLGVRTLMRARKDSPFSRPLHLLLLPDEIHITTAGSTNGYKWSAILNVTEIPTHFFFWISQRDAIIVPKRVFPRPSSSKNSSGPFNSTAPHTIFLVIQ